MPTPLPPLPGHAIFLLLIQLALLLVVARAGAELAKRAGLPAVVGELMAGIVLGPSLFGRYAPAAFALIFPRDALQFHLLEMMGTLGMVLLLLLTGFETDLRLLRNLGRAALVASIAGMIVPFAMGYGLGQWMPGSALSQPAERGIFSAFLATAMAISAMPVIAKILMDLDLTRRDIGVVILSAGVIDDTVGWLCLSVIAGAATTGAVHLAGLGITLASIAGFLLAMAVVVYPLTRLAVRAAARMRAENADLVLVVVLTFLAAAATERIGVHAVFGAFVTGAMLRQVPLLRQETIHKLEQFILAVLAPVFFGTVGLKVNVWALGDGRLFGIVLAVACVGKLVGCFGGSLWGGLRFWEALSIAVAMNTRGAMELVVASIGLSLGILTEQMFSVIVMVAVVTSLMAPLLLRLTIPRVRLTEEEARRIHAESAKGAFDPAQLRLLLPTSGGANAVEAARLALPLAERSGSPVEAVHVERRGTFWQRLLHPFRKRARAIEEHLDTLRALGAKVRRLTAAGVADGVLAEAGHGYDLLVLGASARGSTVGGQVLPEIVAGAPCHVAIVRAAASPRDIHRVLVPVDGTMAGRVAAELACRFAEASGAELTLAVLADHRPRSLPPARQDSRPTAPPPLPVAPEEEVDRISPVFRGSTVKPRIVHLDDDPAASALLSEVTASAYDLVVLGAENRAIRHRLFLGRQSHRILRESPATVMVVVPNVARLA
jgi:Kef-type K+ transport system membrane component KefB/nucleotide-binding universal stress UspA family protein